MKHLRYDLMGAGLSGERRHPEEVMRDLGITFEKAIPQSMADQWWLFNCQHGELPSYITEMKCDRWLVNQYGLPDSYLNHAKYIDVKQPHAQESLSSSRGAGWLSLYSGAMQKLADDVNRDA